MNVGKRLLAALNWLKVQPINSKEPARRLNRLGMTSSLPGGPPSKPGDDNSSVFVYFHFSQKRTTRKVARFELNLLVSTSTRKADCCSKQQPAAGDEVLYQIPKRLRLRHVAYACRRHQTSTPWRQLSKAIRRYLQRLPKQSEQL